MPRPQLKAAFTLIKDYVKINAIEKKKV